MISIRLARTEDIPYLRTTWVDSFADWDGIGQARSVLPHQLRPSIYREVWRSVVADLLSRCDVLVAFDPDYPDVIVGWVAFERPPKHLPIIHFAYTRYKARRTGVLKGLLQHVDLYDVPIAYSHRTTLAQRIARDWERTWVVPPQYDFTLAFRRPVPHAQAQQTAT